MSRSGLGGFSLSYFTPAIKPRLKPTFKPHVTATGISGIHFKPRVLPTTLSGKARIPSGATGGTSISSLTRMTHSGVKSSGTRSKPPTASRGKTVQPTGSKPAGQVKIPRSIAAQPVKAGPKITTPKKAKVQIKTNIARSNPLHIKQIKI